MPNWCDNSITISGPEQKISAMWDLISNEEEVGLLGAMVPQPPNLFREGISQTKQEELDKQGIPNWYDWNITNWGTKWEVASEFLEYESGTIFGSFDSAWSPPETAYATFCRNNPDCSIWSRYIEIGLDFAGIWNKTEEGYGFLYTENFLDDWKNNKDSILIKTLIDELGDDYFDWLLEDDE